MPLDDFKTEEGVVFKHARFEKVCSSVNCNRVFVGEFYKDVCLSCYRKRQGSYRPPVPIMS